MTLQVDYVDHMGSDLTVVNSARVSFAKHKESFDKSDEELVRYLADHNHWTPFSHPTITVRVTAPVFVARQLFKHKVGMTENEVSRRYVSDEPEFFFPEEWRAAPTNGAKQGSSKTDAIKEVQYEFAGEEWDSDLDDLYSVHLSRSTALYNAMIKAKVAPELARMVLPQSMITSWYWTGSLSSFARIYGLRSAPDAQEETQVIAKQLDAILRPLFPVCWDELTTAKGEPVA